MAELVFIDLESKFESQETETKILPDPERPLASPEVPVPGCPPSWEQHPEAVVFPLEGSLLAPPLHSELDRLPLWGLLTGSGTDALPEVCPFYLLGFGGAEAHLSCLSSKQNYSVVLLPRGQLTQDTPSLGQGPWTSGVLPA